MKAPRAAYVTLGFIISSAVSCISACDDVTGSFTVTSKNYKKPQKNCNWASKKVKRCFVIEVIENCPITCGLCCADTANTFKIDGKDATCDYVGANPDKVVTRCARFPASVKCPLTCGICTPAPSSSPTVCQDVTGDFYVRDLDLRKNCRWAGRGSFSRRCGFRKVARKCPATCGKCGERVPSASPSKQQSVPSSFPSISPSRVPSRSPSTSPSTLPSNSPSTLPSIKPTIQPSATPSVSDSPSCIPFSEGGSERSGVRWVKRGRVPRAESRELRGISFKITSTKACGMRKYNLTKD